MSTPPATPRSPRIGRIIVVGALLLVAASILVAGVASQRTTGSEHALPTAVATLIPDPSAVAFRQDSIGAELLVDYKGALAIDGRDIPLDQITVEELGSTRRITFQPGPDRVITQLAPGPHNATVYWWPETQKAPNTYGKVPAYTWSFKVA